MRLNKSKSLLFVAIDCGTTSVKAAVVDQNGCLVASHLSSCPCSRRVSGAVENDPRHIRRAVFSALRGAVGKTGARSSRIAAISVTGQRATVFCLGADGEPVAPGLNWQDMRGARETALFESRVGSARFTALTGLPCNTVFTLGKWLYLRAHQPDLIRRTKRFALINDYILGLLGARNPPVDWSSASLTGFFDTGRCRWSPAILTAAGLEVGKLPGLAPPGQRAGALSCAAAQAVGLTEGIPLITGAGDQQCAGLGAGAIRPGVVEITIGTAAVPLAYSARFRPDPRRRIMCCAHALPGSWNLEGLQNSAGSSVEWMKKVLGRKLMKQDVIWGTVARLPPGSGGVRFLPYMAGSAAPHWDKGATGAFLGLTLAHGPESLLRAVLEGVSFETRENIDTFTSLGVPVDDIRVTGGYTHISAWNSILAGVLGRSVSLLEEPQASMMGAAILAAVGVGAYDSIEAAVSGMVRIKCRISPDPAQAAAYGRLFSEYRSLGGLFRNAGLFGSLDHGGGAA